MSEQNKDQEYRVLARKYRPQNFDELIGQDALVRTLKNAIETNRVAHAFMLTGVRGVGKTTTARIIAKALNYTGADGTAGATTGDTSDCKLCQAIAEDRHPDVMEMDAASRTGIDDIREILDGVRYAPSEARYKIYIIDEVHMLSKNAFNALLKTLEEPPPHVKFIFATTEIRKVPITVLSRCQRFDLRRVDVEELSKHFSNIVEKEGVKAEDEAIAMIARAADGSVRDGLSLLDQAISLSDDTITAATVKDMIGMADRARSLDLVEALLTGDVAKGLDIADDLYKGGTDPLVMMQDLLDVSHILTRLRAVPETAGTITTMSSDQIARALEFASKLSMPSLGKAWQILLKGVQEVSTAPNGRAAADMVLIRLAYAADLPDPASLIRKIQNGETGPNTSSTETTPPQNSNSGAPSSHAPALQSVRTHSAAPGRTAAQASVNPATMSLEEQDPETAVVCNTLHDIVTVLEDNNALILSSSVQEYIRPVKIKNGVLECGLNDNAPDGFVSDLTKKLRAVTQTQWVVTIIPNASTQTLSEQAKAQKQNDIHTVMALPIMKDFMNVFPDAELIDIT